MSELAASYGGQISSVRGSDTGEQRTRRLYKTNLNKALDKYPGLATNREYIVSEVLGNIDETGNISMPDAVHLHPLTLAGAYYILELLNIKTELPDDWESYNNMFIKDGVNLASSNELYREIAIIKMTTGSPIFGGTPTLTDKEKNLIVSNIMKDAKEISRGREIRKAHMIDLFHYAIKIVNYRASRV